MGFTTIVMDEISDSTTSDTSKFQPESTVLVTYPKQEGSVHRCYHVLLSSRNAVTIMHIGSI